MDSYTAEPPLFSVSSSEEPTLSPLDPSSDDEVEHSYLPPRPSSVCDKCWESIAIHFGLSIMSLKIAEDERDVTKTIWYDTSFADLKFGADGGCAWCQLFLKLDERPGERSVRTFWDSRDLRTHFYKLVVFATEHSEGTEYFVYTNPEDPAASYITELSPLRDVGSPRALELARKHLDDCVREHEDCLKSSAGIPRLPSRLMDCSSPPRPRLVSTIGQRGEYLALSYVWGGDQVHKTTNANISAYTQGISLDNLPATIRDAIYVTHMLGFRWLWVDSLCIIQDSDEDKLHEIGRMHHIYRYAHLTIMAGSAKNVNEGFLQERRDIEPDELAMEFPFICPPPPTTSIELLEDDSAARSRVGTIFLTPADDDLLYPNTLYSDSLGVMVTRAWCMQEYFLSPRALIFTPETLVFRCLSSMEGVGPSLFTSYDEPDLPISLFVPPPPGAALDPDEQKSLLKAWGGAVEEYSRRTASVESDKLVACAGLAEQYGGLLGPSTYRAGFWTADQLLVHLLWKADHSEELGPLARRHTRPTAYRAPSWSWAAIEGPISNWPSQQMNISSPPGPRGPFALAEVHPDGCKVTLENPELPFGQVKDGALVLRGILIPGHWYHEPDTGSAHGSFVPTPSFERIRCQLWRYDADTGYPTISRGCALVAMDCDVDELRLPEKMWLVPFMLEHCIVARVESHRRMFGLVIELDPLSIGAEPQPKESRFRRIGYFERFAEDSQEELLWGSLARNADVPKNWGHHYADIVIV
ncbi:HET-domain-containing protein [Trametes versicolor FP-101664 SS1]|uniref:HET-domain-containing protein n=1 Tax=Trametes versicolor (strain FP-101664) TaxID=717944 RepID=UPI00046218E6|nr:HET-domain-containing protein [Trametes versicolor FP-101664 SS1]EIW52285.1 HET-domain-containing protein [Trametes versicolor FP-101664 SS1]